MVSRGDSRERLVRELQIIGFAEVEAQFLSKGPGIRVQFMWSENARRRYKGDALCVHRTRCGGCRCGSFLWMVCANPRARRRGVRSFQVERA